ncbi:MAG: hypothetical protein ISQ06_02570 [Planctomycetaceae bacterium]|nr:hypothetical protein [Planctomycetaceae bacterium]
MPALLRCLMVDIPAAMNAVRSGRGESMHHTGGFFGARVVSVGANLGAD